MSQWLNQVIANEQIQADWLMPLRQQALSDLKNSQWPSKKVESWRFTPVTALEQRDANPVKKTSSQIIDSIPGVDAIEIVFSGGQMITDPNTLQLPKGVTLCSFESANDAQQQAIKALLGKIKPSHHIFGIVNDAMCQQGIYLHIDQDVECELPIHIHQIASENVDLHSRILVHLEPGARATVIEHGYGKEVSTNTCFAEYKIDEKAQLEHYRFSFFNDRAVQLGGLHFELAEQALLNSNIVGFGSELSRIDADVNYTGENANAVINAIYLLAPGELFDLHTTIEHAVPHCTTEENVRGIVGDNAKAVFNGRIHIHRDAQKTLAELNNRNLLLSRRALVNTKPELEIYADDVRCAHGATIAEISEQELYYLLSRGISRSKALVMLNFGFIQELINAIPNESIASWLQPLLSERFSNMEVK